MPDIKQAKDLSKVFNVSLDELVDNDINSVVIEKVDNNQKTTNLIYSILKILGILMLITIILIIISIGLFGTNSSKENVKATQSVRLTCELDGHKYHYLIEYDENDDIIESSGSEYIINLVKNKKYTKGSMLAEYIISYFKDNGGQC